ncbi:septum site-determining protein MinC [Halotalea alkalilenta]|uniref:septum site-determining protein MinC n=1 Tax=Halotalea alkalilenta TaxID=376489 RepID=UPI000483119E|nr:septum site-determining protein MinC [Halotalea alkalilenta]
MSLELDAEQVAFTFKGGMLPLTVIELASGNIERIEAQLSGKISQSPAFFQHTPVVIGLERLPDEPLALDQLCAMLRRHRLLPVAVRGGNDAIKQSAWALGIGWFPPQEGRAQPVVEPVPVAPLPEEAPPLELRSGRIFRGTVRSGQQVSAPRGDLVVVGAVNAGAEILAAGSIHVYGPLRGRALAGIHGDQDAAVFCHELDAELLSVAGNYKRLEDIPPDLLGKSVQVRMVEDQLEISAFEPLRV